MGIGWVGAFVLGLGWVGSARAEAPSPFTRLEGVEVAPTARLRGLAWSVFAYSLDGGRLLAADAEGAALIDERGAVHARLGCAAAAGTAPTDLSLSGDNAVAAARYANGAVCTWSGNGVALGTPAARATTVAAGGARMVAVGYADGRVEGRDPRTGARRWSRNPDLGPVVHMRWEAAGPRVAASTGPGGVAVLDSRSGRLVRALRGRAAFSAAFGRDGRTLAVGRANGRVELWDTGQWYQKGSFVLTSGDVVDLDFSAEGDMVAAAIARTRGDAREIVLEVWDIRREEPVFREIALAGDGPARLRFDALGERLVAGNGLGAGRLWPRPGTGAIPRPPPNDEPPHQRPWKEEVELPAVTLGVPTRRAPGALLASDDGRRLLARVEAAAPSSSGGGGAEPPRNAPPPGARATGEAGAVGAPRPADVAAALAPGLVVYDLARGGEVALADSAEARAPFAIAPDGARVAAVVDQRVVVWDAATGGRVARVAIGDARAIALLGERLAVVTAAGGALVGTLDRVRAVPKTANVSAIALDPFHGDRLAVGTTDGGVRDLAARTGASLGAWAVHAGAPTALAFSADGRLLASAGPRPGATGGRLVVLGTERAEEPAEPWGAVLDAIPERLAFEPDARRLLARGPGLATVLTRDGVALDHAANLVDAALVGDTLRWVDTFGEVREATVGAVRPAVPRGRFFARSDDFRFSVTVDGDRLAVWNDKSGRLLRELPPTGQAVAACVFDDAGERLAVRYADATVEVYEVATGEVLRNVPGAPEGAEPWLRFSEDGLLLWGFSAPDVVTAWSIETGAARETVALPGPVRLDPATARLRFVRFTGAAGEVWLDTHAESPRRRTVAADGFGPRAVLPRERQVVGTHEGALARFDADTGRRVGPELRVPGDAPTGPAAVSADGAWLAAAYGGGLVRVWDLARGQVAAVLGADARTNFAGPVQPVASLAFDAAGEIVTTRDATGFPRLFEWRLSVEGPVVGLGAGPVLPSVEIVDLAISPDGATLFSAHRDAAARSWDLRTGAQTNFYGGHAGPLTDLAVAQDGRRLVTAGEDGTVRAWDTMVAGQRAALSAFGDPVRRLAVTGDGWTVAGVGDGAVLRTWDGGSEKGLARWAVAGPIPDALALGPVRGALEASIGTARWTLDPVTGAVAPGAVGPVPGGAPPEEDPSVVALRSVAAALSPVTAEARTATLYVTAGADGRIRVWDREALALRYTLRALTDGSWVLDRTDGTRYASESLRDGSSPLLYRPPPR